MGADVQMLHWDIMASGQGLDISGAYARTRWSPDLRVERLQCIPLRRTDKAWTPGLLAQNAFNPCHWGVQAKGWTQPHTLRDISIRDLYIMLQKTTEPVVWTWWKGHLPQAAANNKAIMAYHNYTIRTIEPRSASTKDLTMKYWCLANRPKYMVSPTDCSFCGHTQTSVQHAVWGCELAKALWLRATDLMSRVRGKPVRQPISWAHTVAGVTNLADRQGKRSEYWIPTWLAIHGAALRSMHMNWLELRHRGTPLSQDAHWGRFRHDLSFSVQAAYRQDTDPDKTSFRKYWAANRVLASFTQAPHPSSPITLLPGVAATWPT